MRDGTRPGNSVCLLQQSIAGIEFVAQTGDSRELGEHLGTPRVVRLVIQLYTQSLLGCVQIVEVPQGAQTVRHRANFTPVVAGLRTD